MMIESRRRGRRSYGMILPATAETIVVYYLERAPVM
jgi:hypothetical protein